MRCLVNKHLFIHPKLKALLDIKRLLSRNYNFYTLHSSSITAPAILLNEENGGKRHIGLVTGGGRGKQVMVDIF
jgi:hypothetical protein